MHARAGGAHPQPGSAAHTPRTPARASRTPAGSAGGAPRLGSSPLGRGGYRGRDADAPSSLGRLYAGASSIASPLVTTARGEDASPRTPAVRRASGRLGSAGRVSAPSPCADSPRSPPEARASAFVYDWRYEFDAPTWEDFGAPRYAAVRAALEAAVYRGETSPACAWGTPDAGGAREAWFGARHAEHEPSAPDTPAGALISPAGIAHATDSPSRAARTSSPLRSPLRHAGGLRSRPMRVAVAVSGGSGGGAGVANGSSSTSPPISAGNPLTTIVGSAAARTHHLDAVLSTHARPLDSPARSSSSIERVLGMAAMGLSSSGGRGRVLGDSDADDRAVFLAGSGGTGASSALRGRYESANDCVGHGRSDLAACPSTQEGPHAVQTTAVQVSAGTLHTGTVASSAVAAVHSITTHDFCGGGMVMHADYMEEWERTSDASECAPVLATRDALPRTPERPAAAACPPSSPAAPVLESAALGMLSPIADVRVHGLDVAYDATCRQPDFAAHGSPVASSAGTPRPPVGKRARSGLSSAFGDSAAMLSDAQPHHEGAQAAQGGDAHAAEGAAGRLPPRAQPVRSARLAAAKLDDVRRLLAEHNQRLRPGRSVAHRDPKR